jgi:hypothetical protein
MEERDRVAAPPAMYLAYEHWSPRYETTFYTVKIDGFESLRSAPSTSPSYGGKSNHPAFYYKLDVFCGHSTRSVLRRYSEFQWLFNQLPRSADVVLPPGTCFCYPQDETFAQNRSDQLREFLRDLLQQPTFASHPTVVDFLEINEIAS